MIDVYQYARNSGQVPMAQLYPCFWLIRFTKYKQSETTISVT